ncbi:hypothetical protein HPP92_021822 [Vanilla planifolia]|uniref:Uncharacterized protein n=1 Tax=Vanilla planifolia TaxID=51239 RepID=A0A835UD94_VANPL|nr:hypothetical protein HPP92_022145 [Vanilla planifolia]KAG0458694.1 hypothetical protein HPP92_021822 [Vanilla planifolia]
MAARQKEYTAKGSARQTCASHQSQKEADSRKHCSIAMCAGPKSGVALVAPEGAGGDRYDKASIDGVWQGKGAEINVVVTGGRRKSRKSGAEGSREQCGGSCQLKQLLQG